MVESFRGSSPRGFLTGPELSALVTRVRAATLEGETAIREDAADLMTMALAPRNWASRAHHMAALAMFMFETHR